MVHVCFLEDTKLEGGTQLWVAEAARWLIGNGDEVTLLCPEGSFNARDAAEIKDCRLRTYSFQKVEYMGPAEQVLWTEALKPADVCVTTVQQPRNGFHVMLFAAKCIEEEGLKTVLLAKAGSYMKEYLREYYYPPHEIAKRMVFIADFTRRAMIEAHELPVEATTLIYQGTETTRFVSEPGRREEARQKYSVPEGAFPHFGCMPHAYLRRKGQNVLLSAFAKVQAEHPSAFLSLVSQNGHDGDVESELRAQAAELGLERVAFHPFTAEPLHVYEAIDALVVSSFVEGLPNGLLEALAMGKPCVSTNVAGIPEVVTEGETGFLCEPGDPDGLAAAMLRLCALGAEGSAQLGENGRRMVREKMNKQTQFGKFREFFESVARA